MIHRAWFGSVDLEAARAGQWPCSSMSHVALNVTNVCQLSVQTQEGNSRLVLPPESRLGENWIQVAPGQALTLAVEYTYAHVQHIAVVPSHEVLAIPRRADRRMMPVGPFETKPGWMLPAVATLGGSPKPAASSKLARHGSSSSAALLRVAGHSAPASARQLDDGDEVQDMQFGPQITAGAPHPLRDCTNAMDSNVAMQSTPTMTRVRSKGRRRKSLGMLLTTSHTHPASSTHSDTSAMPKPSRKLSEPVLYSVASDESAHSADQQDKSLLSSSTPSVVQRARRPSRTTLRQPLTAMRAPPAAPPTAPGQRHHKRMWLTALVAVVAGGYALRSALKHRVLL